MKESLIFHYLIIFLFSINTVSATDFSEKEESIYQMGETSLATGYSQPLVRAPAITTIITAQDIEKMGATTVADVLKTVPSLHVSTARGITDIFLIRGFFDEMNSYVLLMINGIPLNNIVNSGQPQAWRMPVHNIARIEIMRGPGSAIYGADAAAGVINIVTKTAKDIEGVKAGFYGGSFDTYGTWVQSGGQLGNIEAAFSLEAATTNGYQKIIKADDQTRIDRLLGTHASLAPGEINTQRKDLDARIDLKGESWRFRAGHQGFLNVGTGAGVILALDPNGDFNTRLNNADITYDFIKSSQWDITAQMSYLGTLTEASLNPYPPGIFGRAFPDGLKDDFQFRVDEIRAGITALYGGISNHRIRFGIGTSYTRLSDVEESRNFKILPNGMPLPLPFSNVLTFGEQPLLAEHDRQLWYGFAQDEWWFAPDWILTTGARLDHYSDFGTTINPRVALVWNASSSLTAKALYGRAFRAPSFTELYGNSTIAVLGNLNLKPEIINMIEFSLTKQWDPQLRTNASLFGYSLDDQIRGGIESSNPLVKMQKRNTLGRHGYGMELESEYAATKDLRFQASYAYFSFDDAATNDRGRFMPKHQLSAGFDWHITDYWMLNTRLDWVSKRELMYENKKAVVDSYPWASVSLRYSDPKDWFFSVTLDNALDIDAAEPSVFPSVPYGIPLPGRSLMGQFGWRFR